MKILALDTATEACSAALLIDDEILSRYQLAPRQHAALILPMLDELMAESGLRLQDFDAVAFGRGPGSFTGVRIAASVAQGVAFAGELPVAPISTLAAMAQWSMDNHQVSAVAATIDARMGEVYWGCYRRNENGKAQLEGEEQVIKPDQVALPSKQEWYFAGTGWERYSALLSSRLNQQYQRYIPAIYPHASAVARLAVEAVEQNATIPADTALPVYLRNKVV